MALGLAVADDDVGRSPVGHKVKLVDPDDDGARSQVVECAGFDMSRRLIRHHRPLAFERQNDGHRCSLGLRTGAHYAFVFQEPAQRLSGKVSAESRRRYSDAQAEAGQADGRDPGAARRLVQLARKALAAPLGQLLDPLERQVEEYRSGAADFDIHEKSSATSACRPAYASNMRRAVFTDGTSG